MKRLIDILILAPVAALALPVLIDSALKGTVLLAAILISMLALRRASAALRHFVLIAAMLTLLVLPILSLTLPDWRVLPAWAQLPALEDVTPFVAGGPSPALMSDSGFTDSALAVAPEIPTIIESESGLSWLPALSGLWMLGGGLLGLWLAAAQFALWRVGRQATHCADPALTNLLAQLRDQLGVRRQVHLLIHAQRAMPMTWGLFRTRLLLPADSAQWDEDRMRAVLLHELAHVKRRDCLTQLLVRITCAVHWFNPLVWIAARRVACERERACDDLVLNSGVRASDYAGHLLHIATSGSEQRLAGSSALAMAKRSRLEGRLQTILNRAMNRRSTTRRAALMIGLALTVAAMPVAMMRATAEEVPEPFAELPPTTVKLGSFFFLDGEIVSVDEEHQVAIVNRGSNHGLRKGEVLLVLRQKIPIARLKIVYTKDALSGCLIEPKQQPSGFHPRAGDRVRTGMTVNGHPEQILSEMADLDDPRSIVSQDVPRARSSRGDSGTQELYQALMGETLGDEPSEILKDPWGKPYFMKLDEGYAVQEKSLVKRSPVWGRSHPKKAQQVTIVLEKYADSAEFLGFKQKLASLKAQRAELIGSGFGPKHPRVMAVESAIDSIENSVIRLGAKMDLQAQRDAAFKRLETLKVQRAELLAKGFGRKHPEVLRVEAEIETVTALYPFAIVRSYTVHHDFKNAADDLDDIFTETESRGSSTIRRRINFPDLGDPIIDGVAPEDPASAKRVESDDAAVKATTRLLVELAARRAELVASGFGSKHPEVVGLDRSIELTKKRLAAGKPLLVPGEKGLPLVGVGAVLALEKGRGLMVKSVIKGGPAALGKKLAAGDRITAVAEGVAGEWVTTNTKELHEVVALIRGAAGSVVRLRIVPAGQDAEREFETTITRAAISIPGPDQGQIILRSYALLRTDAAEIGKVVSAAIGDKGLVRPDARTNVLAVHADPETHQQIETLIEELDAPQ